MTILNKLQKLGSGVMNQVSSCYGNLFPMEVRYNLADFLESRLMLVRDKTNLEIFKEIILLLSFKQEYSYRTERQLSAI